MPFFRALFIFFLAFLSFFHFSFCFPFLFVSLFLSLSLSLFPSPLVSFFLLLFFSSFLFLFYFFFFYCESKINTKNYTRKCVAQYRYDNERAIGISVVLMKKIRGIIDVLHDRLDFSGFLRFSVHWLNDRFLRSFRFWTRIRFTMKCEYINFFILRNNLGFDIDSCLEFWL